MNVQEIRETIRKIAQRAPLPKELQYGRFKQSSSSKGGANNFHKGWGYASPVTNRELQAAETTLGVELPACLRTFYKQIGNGGPGPGDGILPLADLVAHSPRAGKRFPHTSCWRDPGLLDQAAAANQRADRGNGSVEAAIQASEKYKLAGFPGGGLMVAQDMGGDFILVVNGDEVGNVWRVGCNDVAPLGPSKDMPYTIDYDNTRQRLTFERWFIAWLEYADRISIPPS
ncbi:MAG: SMI1/KNR4 family protein [Planctomycetales bacterium]|nr:SMI1/KNR4 family protein [Planctomycetales bacterium]